MPLGAFLEGFFDGKAQIISSRKDEGEEYYRRQAERARRVASEQLAQRRERYQQLATAGNTLMNTANMPEHILRGLVSAGPEAVQTALQLFNEVPQHEWDATDWEEIYSTSEFYAQEFNESLPDFLKRTSGLIGHNYRATSETGGDLRSAFVASALGYDARDRARSRLQDYEVAPGMSAQQALDMESRPLHQSDPDTTYSGPVPRAFMGIAGQYEEGLSPDDLWKWRGRFEDQVDARVEQLSNEARQQGLEIPAGVRQLAQMETAMDMARLLGPNFTAQLPFLHPFLASPASGAPEQPVDGQEPPPSTVPTPTADGLSEGLTEPPVASPDVGGVQDGRFPEQDSPLIPRPSWDPSEVEPRPSMFQRGADAIRGVFEGMGDQFLSPSQRGAVVDQPPASPPPPEGASGDFGGRPPQAPAMFPSVAPSRPQGTDGPQPRRPDMSPSEPPKRPRASVGAVPHHLDEKGMAVLPDGRTTILKGIDPHTQSWVYEDISTGEEIHIPLAGQ